MTDWVGCETCRSEGFISALYKLHLVHVRPAPPDRLICFFLGDSAGLQHALSSNVTSVAAPMQPAERNFHAGGRGQPL